MAGTPSAYLTGGALLLGALLQVLPSPLDAQTNPSPAVNRDARIGADFLERVQQYMQVRERAKKGSADADGRALARSIGQARSRAQPGDIFTRDIRAHFRQQIARALSGPGGADIRASIMDDNPQGVRVRINERYPETVPFASMPPQVLALLPKLPPELEYRFIGERLILLDVHAHLIVDVIDNALPS